MKWNSNLHLNYCYRLLSSIIYNAQIYILFFVFLITSKPRLVTFKKLLPRTANQSNQKYLCLALRVQRFIFQGFGANNI